MGKTALLVFKSLCLAVVAFLFANSIAFLFDIIQNGIAESWHFKFKHGMFIHNNKPVGMALGTAKANGFLVLFFLLSLATLYRKSRQTQNNTGRSTAVS